MTFGSLFFWTYDAFSTFLSSSCCGIVEYRSLLIRNGEKLKTFTRYLAGLKSLWSLGGGLPLHGHHQTGFTLPRAAKLASNHNIAMANSYISDIVIFRDIVILGDKAH